MALGGPPAVGDEVGPFRITEEIGRGSSAVVYGARHQTSRQDVALKWMLDGRDVPLLKREFRIVRCLSHPHLVQLHELNHDRSGVYFTMERVLGGDVVSRCGRSETDAGRVRLVKKLFAQLADAIQYLHAAAVLHRDIKSGNVLVDADDRVVVVDFGLAQSVEQSRSAGFSGTLAYAAPERLRGHQASSCSDWFSFGVLMFEALTGELPFGSDPAVAMAAAFAGRRARVRGRRSLSDEGLVALLEGLLDPIPERRAGPAEVFGILGRTRSWPVAHTMVGHEVARAWLADRIAGADGRLLAVTGAPGTGKTALVRSVLDGLRADHLILGSRCHPRENVPFNALDGAVTGLLDSEHGCGPEVGTTGLDEDRRLLRCVFERSADLPADAAPSIIADAFLRLVRAAASERRAVIWIDDVQWTDRDSLPLLHELVAAAPANVTWVLVARGDESDVPQRVRPMSRDILHLGPLDEEASLSLLRQLAPGISDARAASLGRLSGGSPLAIEQAATWERDDPGCPLPESLTELTVRTAARRSPAHRELLATLAVHQHGLDRDVLLACENVELTPAYDLLECGLVEFERRPSGYDLRLRHQQITDALLAALPDEDRRRHHLGLALAFERARPDHADARFRHYVGAGLVDRAREPALTAARSFRDALAFYRAAECYRWLLGHMDEGPELRALRHELAEVLSRAGEAMEAGEVYLGLVPLAPPHQRDEIRRAASEQLLRAGDVHRGRALLEECLRSSGIAIPTARLAQTWTLLRKRLRISRLRIRPSVPRTPNPSDSAKIELAWSAGLGLNMVDIVASTLAQLDFTDRALRLGSPEQVMRAVAVEYSYAMISGGPFSARRGERLRAAMEELAPNVASPYARAMAELSWAVGDFFRGKLDDIAQRIARARDGFATAIGPKSWELANCGMYASWAALERGELEAVATQVPELLRLGTARGDVLYRQCFGAGYCATAWLIADRADELAELLDTLPAPDGPFQTSNLFQLIARTRLDLYRGNWRAAWDRLTQAWPRIRRSGLLLLRWPRLVLGVLLVQSALSAQRDHKARALAGRWVERIARMNHPAAYPWGIALRATLRAADQGTENTLIDLADAETRFTATGFRLAAMSVRTQRQRLGERVPVDWGPAVRRPEALANAVGLPPPLR